MFVMVTSCAAVGVLTFCEPKSFPLGIVLTTSVRASSTGSIIATFPVGSITKSDGASVGTTKVLILPAPSTRRITLLFESVMKSSPAASTLTNTGKLSCALVAGPPSPLYPAPIAKLPATVVIVPVRSTLRTTLLKLSAINRFPAASARTPIGRCNFALVAGPPSPLYPDWLDPATVVMIPARSTLRIRLLFFSDVEIARCVQSNPGRSVQRGVRRSAAISEEAGTALEVTGHRAYISVAIHFADKVASRVGDVHISRAIERYVVGVSQLCRRSRAPISRKATCPIGARI